MKTEQKDRQEFIKDNIQVTTDDQKLLDDAKWQVEYYEKELIQTYQRLELAKVTLKSLEGSVLYKQYEICE